MKRLLIVLLLAAGAAVAHADERGVYYDRDCAGPVQTSGERSPELEYNPMENRWEYVTPGEELKYNPLNNRWTYEKPDSDLTYNPFENEWEWVEKPEGQN